MEPRSGIARWARIGLLVSAWLYAVTVAIQVFLAGVSTFDTAERWADHVSFGQMIGTLPILLVLFSVVGRVSIVTIGISIALFFLYGFQYIFANSDVGSVAALHAVNALVMFWLTLLVAQQVRPLAFPSRQQAVS